MSDTPRIYVASLSDYNAGRLHGRWIDATYGADDILEEIEEMLEASSEPDAEEWAIHDYENFGSLKLHEHQSLEAVAGIAELIDEYGEIAAEVIAYYGQLDDLDEAREALEERNAGTADTLEDWAAQYLEDSGALQGVPENLRYYFDFAKYARDLELGGDVVTFRVDGDLHVFWTR